MKKAYYSITLNSTTGVILTFSTVGFTPKQVRLSATSTIINVKMEPSLKDLDDVIVIGYGSVRKKRPYRFCGTGKSS